MFCGTCDGSAGFWATISMAFCIMSIGGMNGIPIPEPITKGPIWFRESQLPCQINAPALKSGSPPKMPPPSTATEDALVAAPGAGARASAGATVAAGNEVGATVGLGVAVEVGTAEVHAAAKSANTTRKNTGRGNRFSQ